MNMKRTGILVAFSVAALAAAAGVATVRVGGVGQVTAADGKKATAMVNLTKVEDGSDVKLRGGFNFELRTRDPRSFLVVRPKPGARGALGGTLVVSAKEATYEGPAKMVVFRPRQRPVVTEGTVRLVVNDLKTTRTGTTLDTYSLRFAPATGNALEFAGNVTRGDFRVWTRPAGP